MTEGEYYYCSRCKKKKTSGELCYTYIKRTRTIGILCDKCVVVDEIEHEGWKEKNKYNRFDIMEMED